MRNVQFHINLPDVVNSNTKWSFSELEIDKTKATLTASGLSDISTDDQRFIAKQLKSFSGTMETYANIIDEENKL